MNAVLPSLAVVACLAGPGFGDTWTVGPTGDFTEIQPAVDAAAPGDSILVEAGTYAPFEIAKPLNVLGAGAESVMIAGVNTVDFVAMGVHDIGPFSSVVVSGMSFSMAEAVGTTPLLHVYDNEGSVLLHDIETTATFLDWTPGPVLQLTSSDWVTIDQSTIRGGGSFFFEDPSEAVFAVDSEVWIYSSELLGMGVDLGADRIPEVALRAVDSVVYVADSTLKGGDGGVVQIGFDVACYEGAQAAVLEGSAVAKFVDGQFTTGSGGFHPGCFGQPSDDPDGTIELLGSSQGIFSDAIQVNDPGIFTEPGATATFNNLIYPTLALGPVRAAPGESFDVLLSGNASSAGLLFYALGLGTNTLGLPGVDGVFALNPLPFLGTLPVGLDAAGEQVLPLVVPVDASLLGVVVHFQWLELDPSQNGLSNPTLLPVR